MKIYEKPMALIEKIEVEDVITASDLLEAGSQDAQVLAGDDATSVVVFEW